MNFTSRTGSIRINRDQLSIMVQFMEDHPSLFMGRITSEFPYQLKEKLWRELTDLLNEKGPHKTVSKWMRTWADWKSTVKKKVFQGSRPGAKTLLLSVLENRCAKLLETAALAADIQAVPNLPPEGGDVGELSDSETSGDPEVFTGRKRARGESRFPRKRQGDGTPETSFDLIVAQQQSTNERLDETNATLRDLNLAINNLSRTISNAASLLLSSLERLPSDS